jgi:hypothetical protein
VVDEQLGIPAQSAVEIHQIGLSISRDPPQPLTAGRQRPGERVVVQAGIGVGPSASKLACPGTPALITSTGLTPASRRRASTCDGQSARSVAWTSKVEDPPQNHDARRSGGLGDRQIDAAGSVPIDGVDDAGGRGAGADSPGVVQVDPLVWLQTVEELAGGQRRGEAGQHP